MWITSNIQRMILVALALVGLGIAWLVFEQVNSGNAKQQSIRIYCAVSLEKPVNQILTKYQSHHTVSFETSFMASGQLISEIIASEQPGIFFPADFSYVDQLESRMSGNLNVSGRVVLAEHRPILVVNKKLIDIGSADFFSGKLRYSIADERTAAISRASKKLLPNRWETILGNATVVRTNVSQVAADVNSGFVDAGIVWDSMQDDFDNIREMELKEFRGGYSPIEVALVDSSKPNKTLFAFFRYLNDSPEVRTSFEENGFQSSPSRSIASPEILEATELRQDIAHNKSGDEPW